MDNFNFYHSSVRITVERAFGKINLRWVIFWKHLMFNLDNICLTIEGSIRLHNFLADYRDDNRVSNSEPDELIFQQDLIVSSVLPLETSNNLRRPRGNIANCDKQSQLNGLYLYDKLCDEFESHDIHCLSRKECLEDIYTHVNRV